MVFEGVFAHFYVFCAIKIFQNAIRLCLILVH